MSWLIARSVVQNTVLPCILPLDILRLHLSQEGFGIPEILAVIFLAYENGDLIEYFNHVVDGERGSGCIIRRFPGKLKI